MFFRKFARALDIICIVLYLPVVMGSGECVALCLEPNGSLALDYTHRCGVADHSSKPVHASGIKGIFSPASFSEPVNAPACRDIPLVIGNHTHFAPETDYSLFPVLTCDEFPVLSSNSLFTRLQTLKTPSFDILFRFNPLMG